MTNTTTTPATLPEFFQSVSISAVAKWASDKLTLHTPYDMEVEGRTVSVRSWYFEGKFPRRAAQFFGQWDAPELGKQFTCTVRTMGGHYRGEEPLVVVCFTEYASHDGSPLPL